VLKHTPKRGICKLKCIRNKATINNTHSTVIPIEMINNILVDED